MIRILVPLDGSRVAEEALNHALSIAKTFPAELTLLRVISEADTDSTVADSIDFALWRHEAQLYLDGLLNLYPTAETSVRCLVAEGHPAPTIVQIMTKTKPDLLVLTRYGRGNAQDFAAGGTAQKIVSSADCSVLLLDPRKPMDADRNYHRIIVPIDDTKDSDCAVAIATMIAKIQNASLLLLHVTEEPHLPKGLPATRHARDLVGEMHRIIRQEAERRLRELAAKIPEQIVVDTRIVVSSNISLAIESTADDFNSDLLLLHAQDSRRYGSVNQSMIQYSHRPLFILRPGATEGFASNFRSVDLGDNHREVG